MWFRRLLLATAVLSGCTDALIVYERDGGVDAGPGPGVDGGPRDAATDGCAVPQDLTGIPEGCVLDRPPPRPRCVEPGEHGAIEVAFVDADFSASVGYDLDGHCTTSVGAPTSCTNSRGNVLDSTAGGTDNAFGLILIEGLEVAAPSFRDDFERTLRESGTGAPMLRIEGWNGLPDDDVVAVTLAVAAGTSDPRPLDWETPPTLDPAEGFFNSSGVPLARDLDAYVSGGLLVADLPDGIPFELIAEGVRLMVAVRDARFVAQIDDTGVRDFVVFGRWPLSDAREAVDTLVPCMTPTDIIARMGAIALFERSADVRASASEDLSDLECNAVSVAMRFREGRPIRWGEARPIEVMPMCD
ncbi:MAG: hypothetical protein KF901_24850 [Myxococcales bacterium]|nr:hypothetical protein [Myxococcales bacterium]